MRDGDDERAQLVLAGALVLGVLLVALALVLNTVIFTENLATRQSGVEDTVPQEHRAAAVEASSATVDNVNREHNDSWSALESNLTETMANWSASTTRYSVAEGAVANASVVNATEGSLILQTNRSRNFTAGGSSAGDGNWTLVTTDRTNSFWLNVSNESLYRVSETGDLSPAAQDEAAENAFHVAVDDGTVTKAYLFQDGDGKVRVMVEEAGVYTGANDTACRQAGEHVVVDLVESTVGDRICSPLGLVVPSLTEHTIEYRNASVGAQDRANGTYRLLVSNASVVQTPYFDQSTGDSPFTTPAVWSATIRVRYLTAETEYTARESVTPSG